LIDTRNGQAIAQRAVGYATICRTRARPIRARDCALIRPPYNFAWLGTLLLYAAAALICTWPLAPQLYTHLPLGSLSNGTVPLFNVWTLEWNVHSLARGYRGYWDAPIFYPTRGSFALSETQALTGLVFAVLRPLFGSVAGYNSILLANLVLNAFAARRVLRVLGASPVSATLSGLLALGLPFVWKELGVLQLTALWPLWFALAELALLSRAAGAGPPPLAAGPRLALCCAATLWTCSYYALFLSVFLLLWAALFVRRELFTPPAQRAALLGSGLLLLAAAAPLALSQPRLMRGYSRSAETIHDGSATARGYVRLPRGALGGELVPFMQGQPGRRSLSPGLVLSGLALLGAWSVRGRLRRKFLIWCGASLALALVLSFGSRWSLGPWQPYASIVERYWPGFAHVRSPYRFAAFVQLFALLFAGFGLEALRLRLRARRDLLVTAATLLALLEVVPFGGSLTRFPSEAMRAPWVTYLAQHPGGALVMIPPADSRRSSAYEPTVVAMLQSLRHGHPLLNGYSGFFPPSADRLAGALRHFPEPRSQHLLARMPVRYAVIDKSWLGTRDLAPLQRVFDGATQVLYRIQ
jgi:hypothetical protein